jgi:hypothetical protein
MEWIHAIAGRQWVLGLLVLVLALALPRPGARAFRALLQVCTALARRPVAALLLAGLLGGGGTALVAILGRFPEPRVHDEFGYLLIADTLAHGRLTNPAHPCWEHFESFHINVVPTYQAKFHPGQGVALAVGQVGFGHPIVGVWLEAALFGGLLLWMLTAWLPPRWAIFGAGLGILHFDVTTYWTQSYWGGTLAAVAGALVFGALPRLISKARVRDALLLGLGVGLLGVTRPFEGAVSALPAGIWLAAWSVARLRAGELRRVLRVTLGTAIPIAVVLVALGAYHLAVTGDPFLFPYTVHDTRYATLTPFLWVEPFEVEPYRHAVIRDFWAEYGLGHWQAQQTLAGYWRAVSSRSEVMWSYFLGPYLSLPLLALPWAWRRRGLRFSLIVLASLTAGLAIMTYRQAHYAAPVTVLVVLILVQCMRHLALLRWRGRSIGSSLIVGSLLMLAAFHAGQAVRDAGENDRWCEHRAAMLRELEASGRRHLVVVEYGPEHDFLDEWVYNAADIDGAAVVWARDMGAEENADLLEHFAGREIWRLRLGFGEAREELVPYSP